MDPFPHRYTTTAAGGPGGALRLDGPGLPTLGADAPAEFGGPGDAWSPETMLVGAVTSCFVLTFRSVAAAMKLPWTDLACEADGTLDRVDRVTRFTEIAIRARLRVPPGTDAAAAHRAMEKAEQICLVTRSLTAEVHLVATVEEG